MSDGVLRWTTRDLTRAGCFAALTAVGAWLSIPMPLGVPLTFQVFVTLLSGIVLGRRVGALSQLIYVGMGAVGLPVYAGRIGGIQELVGPTGGYLIGFVIAAWIVGRISEGAASRSFGRDAVALVSGLIAVYVPGTLVLSVHVQSFKIAFIYGALVYLPLDLMKAGLALAVARGLEARGLGRVEGSFGG